MPTFYMFNSFLFLTVSTAPTSFWPAVSPTTTPSSIPTLPTRRSMWPGSPRTRHGCTTATIGSAFRTCPLLGTGLPARWFSFPAVSFISGCWLVLCLLASNNQIRPRHYGSLTNGCNRCLAMKLVPCLVKEFSFFHSYSIYRVRNKSSAIC